MRAWLRLSLAVIFSLAAFVATAEPLRVGAQMTGTLGWELGYMKTHGLDAGLDLQIVDLANTEAGKVALISGAVDVILSDWLWVARERGLGRKLTFVPYSAALGALMVKGDSALKTLSDLRGKTLGVAGGPLDKSWLLLQAYAKRNGFDIANEARIAYAAPPLVNQKLADGDFDAALQFWNFAADLQTRGFRPLVEVADIEKALGAKGPVAIVGFVFDEAFAAQQGPALARFIAAARSAKAALAADAAAWRPILARLGAADPAAAALYRARYLAGVTQRPLADEEADAGRLFKALVEIGGPDLVGSAQQLDAGVYFKAHGGS